MTTLMKHWPAMTTVGERPGPFLYAVTLSDLRRVFPE